MKFFPRIASIAFVTVTFLVTGCSITTTNLTPPRVPQNPSGIYTLSAATAISTDNIDRRSVKLDVVIDGETYPMSRDPQTPGIFNFDYALPADRDAAKFFYITRYKTTSANAKAPYRERKSNLHQFLLSNRYVVSLETNRAPVGSTVPVLGRGFGPTDTIIVGPIATETRFISENVLHFTVPGLMAGQSYDVVWESGYGNIPLGKFRIDAAQVSVLPQSLSIRTGQSRPLTFRIDSPAPPSGLLIRVTTDIPDSVIMPEVIIPAGHVTNTVQVRGGTIGSGNLYISIAGQNEVVVPVTVTE